MKESKPVNESRDTVPPPVGLPNSRDTVPPQTGGKKSTGKDKK